MNPHLYNLGTSERRKSLVRYFRVKATGGIKTEQKTNIIFYSERAKRSRKIFETYSLKGISEQRAKRDNRLEAMYVLSSKRFEKNWSFLKFRIENRTYIGPASVKKKIHTYIYRYIHIHTR